MAVKGTTFHVFSYDTVLADNRTNDPLDDELGHKYSKVTASKLKQQLNWLETEAAATFYNYFSPSRKSPLLKNMVAVRYRSQLLRCRS